jgi:heme exporter protein A
MRLIADNLAAERGGETIFEGVSFEVSAGSVLQVTGANGSGKSTLLRVIAGLLPVLAGEVRFESTDTDFPDLGSALHFLGHHNAMKPALSVVENLAFWRAFDGHVHLQPEEALAIVGLPSIGHLPFEYLSTGQRRRVAIARLLVSWRPVWLLDEPTSGLDKASEKQFTALMKAHLDDGGLIIAATHLPLGLGDVVTLDMSAASRAR